MAPTLSVGKMKISLSSRMFQMRCGLESRAYSFFGEATATTRCLGGSVGRCSCDSKAAINGSSPEKEGVSG